MSLREKTKSILKSPMISSTVIVAGGNMIANVSAYLYHVFVGRILGPVGYGELAALLSLLYIISVPSEVLRTVTTKYYSIFFAHNQIGEAKDLLLKFMKYISITGLIGLLVTFPFYGYLANYLKINNSANFFWLYLAVAMQLFNSLNIGILFGFQKFLQSTIILNITIIIRLIIGIISAFFGVLATIAGNTLSTALAVAFYFIPLKFILRSERKSSTVTKKIVLSYSIPTVLAMLGLTALYSMDVVLVKHHFPAYEAGLYASLAVLGKVIFFASNSFGLILFPIIAHKQEEGKSIDNEFWFAILAVFLISSAITTIYFLFPTLVIKILFGSKYLEAAKYVGIFGIFLTFFSLSSILMNVYLAIGKTIIWIFMIIGALSQIIGIEFFHRTLSDVIFVNIFVCLILSISILSFYPYAKKRIS